ncbi:MAG: DHA2 family efflux MFS transporter permease subunit, partial [Rhodospirillales bacterium]|nr:DHA2 family efflux MFS transporter permease subunit [Rhodospirillales bacterium]
AGLAASPDEAAWVQTSYLIAEIVMIPLSGWLSRLLSTRVLFVISAVGFTLFSLACAGASSLSEMVVFRAAQGFIGGAMIPTVFATSFLLFPGSRRAQISVLIGLTAMLAPTIGPTLGGWLTERLSWHWLFLINVPVGAAVAVAVWSWLDIDRPDWSLRRNFDLTGLVLMALFLGALEYVLEEGNRWDWFADETIAWCGVISAIAGTLFFWRMLTRPDPLVELRAFRDLNFSAGSLYSFILGIGLYGSVYLVPLFLGRVRGYNSLQIGETMFVTGAAMFLSAPVAGMLARKMDLRLMLAIGLALFGTGIWWLSRLTVESAFWELFGPQALRGFAMMFVMLPVNQ